MVVGRFQVMALLQAARAYTLGLSLESAHSWGLNRAIFYAAAKRGFRGERPKGGGGGVGPGAPARRAEGEEFLLGDDMAYRSTSSTQARPIFTIGGKPQNEQDFKRQIEARFGQTYRSAWEDALDYVRHFDKDVLESQSRFYSDVYRPKRDEFAAKWSEAAEAVEPTGAAPVRRTRTSARRAFGSNEGRQLHQR